MILRVNLLEPKIGVRLSTRDPLLETPLKANGNRDWESFSDDNFVSYALKVVQENGIRNRRELQIFDYGVYYALRKRGLIGKVGLESERRDFASLTDEQLVSFAQKFVIETEIRNRHGLVNADASLYNVLRKRGLIGKVGLDLKYRDWSSITNEQLISNAQRFIEENGIKTRMELVKADNGLYIALSRRGLIGRIMGLAQRDWASLTDEQLVFHAQKFVKEKGIRYKSGLKKAMGGLYKALLNRELLERIEFEKGKRPWTSFTYDELVSQAQRVIEENGIRNKKGLAKADQRLYRALWRRGLLDAVFALIEQKMHDELSFMLIQAVDSYAANDNAIPEIKKKTA